MEQQFPSFSVLFPFLLFLFLLLKIVKRFKTRNTPNLPPGPWKLPLIGNIHLLIGSPPHHRLRDLANKHGPLMHLQLGEVSNIVISSPEAAKEVMKTHDITFASRPFLLSADIICYNSTDIAFSPYGDYWRQLRKICVLELLSSIRVQSFRSIREEEVSNLIRSISAKAGCKINLSKLLLCLTNSIIARAAFGAKCKDQEAFLPVVREVIEAAAGFSIVDVFPSIKLLEVISGIRSKLKRLHLEVDRLLESIIIEHRASKTSTAKTGEGEADDLVHVLLNLQDHGDLEFPLTTDNIKAVIVDIFFAGTETSSTAVEWAMSEMLRNPRVMAKAQAEVRQIFRRKGNVDEAGLTELKYLKLVIKETLRLHPPVPLLLPRECRDRCEIDGYEIPVKSKVIINAWAIGRDPRHWTEAERFYPERFLDSSIDYRGTHFEFIPFGAGRRICPGLLFGMANIELPLAQFLYHFDWKLPNGMKPEDLDMTENFGATVRREKDLCLIPIPYHNLSVEYTKKNS